MRQENYADFIKSLIIFLNGGTTPHKSDGSRFKFEKYVELGIWRGAKGVENTFELIAPLFKKSYAVDTDPQCYHRVKTIDSLEAGGWYNMTTDDFIENEMPKIGMVDFVFIDACHTYKQSLKDFFGMAPYVRDQGFLLLHDGYPPNDRLANPNGRHCGEVWKTAERIRRDPEINKDFEIVTLPSEFGVSLIRKSSTQTHWS